MNSRAHLNLILITCGLLLLTVLAYLPSFDGSRMLDDFPFINPNVLADFLLSERMLTHTRGVAMTSFSINYAIHGMNLWGYHFVNLAIHLCNGLLACAVLNFALHEAGYDRQRRIGISAIIVGLFLTHPLQTNAVTYLIQRMESLMALFLLTSLFCLTRYYRSGKTVWAVAVVISCALGMRTKEVMVAAPLVLLAFAYLFAPKNTPPQTQLRGRRWLLIAICATWIFNPGWSPLISATTQAEISAGNTSAYRVEDLSSWEYFRTQPQVILKYIQLVFWPADLCLDRGWPVEEDWLGIAAPGALLLMFFGWTVAGLIRKQKASFLGVWFFVILAPTSSIIPIKDLYFEHRMYLPSLACFAGVILLANELAKRIQDRVIPERKSAVWNRGLLISAMCILGILAWGTYQRNQVFHDPLQMWADCIEKAPLSARPYYSFAQDVEKRRLDVLYPQAIEYARKATDLAPKESSYWNVLGLMHRKVGDDNTAVTCFEKAHELDPQAVNPLLNLGNVYALNDPVKAKPFFEQALALSPQHEDANNNYGLVLRRLGQGKKAIPHFEQAIRSNPELWPAYLNLGDVYFADNPNKSLEYYLKVPVAQYDSPGVFNNVAVAILRVRQDAVGAMKYWKLAVTHYPQSIEAWMTLSDVTASLHGKQAGLSILKQAQQKFPGHPEIARMLKQLTEANGS